MRKDRFTLLLCSNASGNLMLNWNHCWLLILKIHERWRIKINKASGSFSIQQKGLDDWWCLLKMVQRQFCQWSQSVFGKEELVIHEYFSSCTMHIRTLLGLSMSEWEFFFDLRIHVVNPTSISMYHLSTFKSYYIKHALKEIMNFMDSKIDGTGVDAWKSMVQWLEFIRISIKEIDIEQLRDVRYKLIVWFSKSYTCRL